MSSNPGPSSSKEDTHQSALPRLVSYMETNGAQVDNEFARKLHSRQLRLELTEADQGEVRPNRPNDANLSSVSAELW